MKPSPALKVRVHYPVAKGELLLRHDGDWEADVRPTNVEGERGCFDFELPRADAYRYFKPILREPGAVRWSVGGDCLVLCNRPEPLDVYPYFEEDAKCHVCDLHEVPSTFLASGRDVRVFLPPGYDENSLERYPVLYMPDGQNLFFADEAFQGKHWRVAETLSRLDTMSLIRRVIVVGIYSRDRMEEYTAPGYEAYGRFVALELKPWVDSHYRTLPGPGDTAVLGSSLGGVVSLHLALSWPDVFGSAGCMSSTFGWRDDLLARVAAWRGARPRVYLDSGWPRDNYEATRNMHTALVQRGFREGRGLQYFVHPEDRHDEESWARRVHLPFQFFFRR